MIKEHYGHLTPADAIGIIVYKISRRWGKHEQNMKLIASQLRDDVERVVHFLMEKRWESIG